MLTGGNVSKVCTQLKNLLSNGESLSNVCYTTCSRGDVWTQKKSKTKTFQECNLTTTRTLLENTLQMPNTLNAFLTKKLIYLHQTMMGIEVSSVINKLKKEKRPLTEIKALVDHIERLNLQHLNIKSDTKKPIKRKTEAGIAFSRFVVRIKLKKQLDRKNTARVSAVLDLYDFESGPIVFLTIADVMYGYDEKGSRTEKYKNFLDSFNIEEKVTMSLSNEVLALYEKKEPVYQTYEYPISVQAMKDAYDRLNRELFGGKLPKCRLKFAPLAKNFYGKYHHKYNSDGSCKDRLITMATITRKDNVQFENTLVHEMIHCWQWYMEEKTGSDKYLDDEGYTGLGWLLNPEKDKHKRGHGEHFHSEMKRINKYGYDVKVGSGMQVEKELLKPVWAMLFFSDTEKAVFVYSVNDPTKHMDTIISNLEEVAGVGFFSSYQVIKTTDTIVNTGLRLTKAFALPKNSVNIYVHAEGLEQYVLNSSLSTLVAGDNIAPSGDKNTSMSPDDVQLLQQMHKHRASEFGTYIGMFIRNSKNITVEHGTYYLHYEWKYPQPLEGVSKEVVEAVYNDWMNVSDTEMKSEMKYVTTGLYGAIRKRTTVDDKYIKEIQDIYDEHFKDRVSMDRFKGVYHKVIMSGLKKDAKKYKKAFDEKTVKEVLKSVVLKGTILENFSYIACFDRPEGKIMNLAERVLEAHGVEDVSEGIVLDTASLNKKLADLEKSIETSSEILSRENALEPFEVEELKLAVDRDKNIQKAMKSFMKTYESEWKTYDSKKKKIKRK